VKSGSKQLEMKYLFSAMLTRSTTMKEDDEGGQSRLLSSRRRQSLFQSRLEEVTITPLPRICNPGRRTGDTATHYSVQLPQPHLCNSFIATFPTYVANQDVFVS
jgi:hypothetical protein